jgi:hypothetical protein
MPHIISTWVVGNNNKDNKFVDMLQDNIPYMVDTLSVDKQHKDNNNKYKDIHYKFYYSIPHVLEQMNPRLQITIVIKPLNLK